MIWIFTSLSAYFFFALSSVLDKIMLKKRIEEPAVFAFYVAILGLFSFVLAPLGFFVISNADIAVSVFSGCVFVYALLFLFRATKYNEISRVASLVVASTQIFLFIFAVIFGKQFNLWELIGFMLLVAGGMLISFDLPLKNFKVFSGFRFSVASGFLMAIAYGLFEYVMKENGFVSGFIWTRVGVFVGGVSLLLVENFRKSIFRSLGFGKDKKEKKAIKRNSFTIFLFFVNKTSSSLASLLLNYSFSIGGAFYVQAVGSSQFVFVLALTALAATKRPDIFEEKMSFWDWFQKIVSVVIIGIGLYFLAR